MSLWPRSSPRAREISIINGIVIYLGDVLALPVRQVKEKCFIDKMHVGIAAEVNSHCY